MYSIQVVNLGSFQGAMTELYPKATQRGASLGLKQFAGVMANEVRAGLPSKTGRLRGAVYDRMVNTLTAAVGLDRRKAFHALFVEGGTKSHPIFPKGRRGSRETKRITRYWRKHPIGATYTGKGAPVPLTRDWRATPLDPRWARLTSGGASGRAAKALTVNGRLLAHVIHPGSRGEHILPTKLQATSGHAAPLIGEAIMAEIQKERRG